MRQAAALILLLSMGCTALPDGDTPRSGDAGSMDAGSVDAGSRDGAVEDGGPLDAGPMDAGPIDAGSDSDSGPVDGGPPDAGCPTYYVDCDGDTYGVDPGISLCDPPPASDLPPVCFLADRAWAVRSGDCNDLDPARNPGETEACDGIDQDCIPLVEPTSLCPSGLICSEEYDCDTRPCLDIPNHTLCSGACVRTDTVTRCGSCTVSCRFGCDTSAITSSCGLLDGLTAGGDRTCGWTERGEVSCWGSAPFGAAPGATLEPLPVTLTFPASGRIIDMDVGPTHQCAILEQGGERSVYCWGSDRMGQLGQDAPVVLPHPKLIDFGVENPIDVEVGIGFTCLLGEEASEVNCWGRDFRLAAPERDSEGFTVAWPSAREIGAGGDFLCAVDGSDRLYCAGVDPASTDGDTFDETAEITEDAAEIAVGLRHLCFSSVGDTATEVLCLGDNALGQVDAASDADATYAMPRSVLDRSSLLALEAGANHTCVVARESFGATTRAVVTCWGANGEGQAGADSVSRTGPIPAYEREPSAATELPVSVPLALGRAHTCVAFQDGIRACWGRAAEGQFGEVDDTGSTPMGGSAEFVYSGR